jgi:hypothetical protein
MNRRQILAPVTVGTTPRGEKSGPPRDMNSFYILSEVFLANHRFGKERADKVIDVDVSMLTKDKLHNTKRGEFIVR